MHKTITKIVVLIVCTITMHAQKGIQDEKTTAERDIERLTQHQQKDFNTRDYETFKLYTDSILDIAQKNDLKELEIDAIIRQGVYYKKIAAYDKALSHYLKALGKSKAIPDSYKKQTVILINSGNIYNEIFNPDEAIINFNNALKYIENHKGPDVYKMACLIGLADAATLKKEYKKALDYNKKAKQIGEQLKRNDIIIAALNNMASNYLDLKKYDTSLECSEKALSLPDDEQSSERRALSFYLKGVALLELERYDEGILPLQMAQGIAFTNEYRKIQMNTHKKLARAYDKKKDFEKANMQRKGYIHYKELYLQSLSKTQRIEVERRLENTNSEKKHYIFTGLVCILILSGFLFFYIKKNKLTKEEAIRLKEDRILLKNENEALKTKIYKLAKQNTSSTNSKENNSIAYQKPSLTEEDRESYLKRILDYMETEKPFLDMDIKQSDIAQNLSMSVHQFSEVLNVSLKKNFNNFINLYRINEAKKMMKKPEYENYKILAIAYEAGFNSKTSFNRVFKQLVGQTPSEYKQQFV